MFAMVATLDAGGDGEAAAEGPGWSLMETDAGGAVTGRSISGLHESLLETEPSGSAEDDLWD
jgi:hypothetical protein